MSDPIAIIGGGIAGLTAACHFKNHGLPFILFEGSNSVAGLMKSVKDEEGFTYDCGVHFLTNRLAAAVGISRECRPMKRYGETVLLNGRNYSYPWGLIGSPRFAASAIKSKLATAIKAPSTTATQHYYKSYGKALSDEVALPLTEAWSGEVGENLAASVGQKFTTGLSRMIMLRAAAQITNRVIGIGYASTITESTNSWHVYPDRGISAVCEFQAKQVCNEVRLNSKVSEIGIENDTVKYIRVGDETIPVAGVVSTAPVHVLASMIRGTNKLDYLRRFKYRAMAFVNLKLEGHSGLSDVVTWVPERRFPFFRISDIGMGLPWLVPDGKSQITCDIGCNIGDEHWLMSDEQLIELCKFSMNQIVDGISKRCLGGRVVRVPLAYPVFRYEYEEDRNRFTAGTGINGLVSIGRNGEFAHILMEDVFWRTRWKVSKLIDGLL